MELIICACITVAVVGGLCFCAVIVAITVSIIQDIL